MQKTIRTLIVALSFFTVVAGSANLAASSTDSIASSACIACWGSCANMIVACRSQCGAHFYPDACDDATAPYCEGGVEIVCTTIE